MGELDPRASAQAEAEKTFDQFIVWTKRTCLAFALFGAVVVVAFVVGAFILSRGEGEDDDDKEWDY